MRKCTFGIFFSIPNNKLLQKYIYFPHQESKINVTLRKDAFLQAFSKIESLRQKKPALSHLFAITDNNQIARSYT
jgi:hypothetical protein